MLLVTQATNISSNIRVHCAIILWKNEDAEFDDESKIFSHFKAANERNKLFLGAFTISTPDTIIFFPEH